MESISKQLKKLIKVKPIVVNQEITIVQKHEDSKIAGELIQEEQPTILEEHVVNLVRLTYDRMLFGFQWLSLLKTISDADLKFYRDEENNCFLHKAIQKNHIEAAKYLIHKGVDLEVLNCRNETPSIVLVRKGDIQLLHYLFQNGGQSDLRDVDGCTLMHVAAGSINALSLMYLNTYVDDLSILERTNGNRTCLHFAALFANKFGVIWLLMNGIDPMVKDNEGNLALHLACIASHHDIAKLLINHGPIEQLLELNFEQKIPMDLAHGKLKKKLEHIFYRREHWFYKLFDKWTNFQYQFAGYKQMSLKVMTFMVSCEVAQLIFLMVFIFPSYNDALMIFYFILAMFSLVVYLYFVSSDPGIIERGCSDPCQENQIFNGDLESNVEISQLQPKKDSLFFKHLLEGNSRAICTTCGIVRPWRSKHCSVVDRCVRRYDHYCPWFGNAIGQNNYILFMFMMLLKLIGDLIYVVIFIFWCVQTHKNISVVAVIIGTPFAFKSFFYMLLSGYNLYTCVKNTNANLTAYDRSDGFSQAWFIKAGHSSTNLFDFGWKLNWYYLCTGQFNIHKEIVKKKEKQDENCNHSE